MTRQEKETLKQLAKQPNVDEVYVKCPVLEFLYVRKERCKECLLNCREKEK